MSVIANSGTTRSSAGVSSVRPLAARDNRHREHDLQEITLMPNGGGIEIRCGQPRGGKLARQSSL
jgi:hypothetical protein